MERYSTECAIWSTPATFDRVSDGSVRRIDSPRSDGEYRIDDDTSGLLQQFGLMNDFERARLTTRLIKRRQEEGGIPEITRDEINAAKNGQPMPVSERIDQVLLFFHRHTRMLGDGISINLNSQNGSTPYDEIYDEISRLHRLLALSESVGWHELKFMLDDLEKMKLIRNTSSNDRHVYVLRLPGFERIEGAGKVASRF